MELGFLTSLPVKDGAVDEDKTQERIAKGERVGMTPQSILTEIQKIESRANNDSDIVLANLKFQLLILCGHADLVEEQNGKN